MKIFPSSSIKKLDAYTIEHEPIASIDLMERAAQALTKAITNIKQLFGGIGKNFVNPALAGRAALVASYAGTMSHWTDGNEQESD